MRGSRSIAPTYKTELLIVTTTACLKERTIKLSEYPKIIRHFEFWRNIALNELTIRLVYILYILSSKFSEDFLYSLQNFTMTITTDKNKTRIAFSLDLKSLRKGKTLSLYIF